MNPFGRLKEKIEMNVFEKVVAGFIERSCKHYVTTIIGVLMTVVFGLSQFSTLIPPQYQTYASLGSVFLMGVALVLAKDTGVKLPTLPTVSGAAKLGMLLAIGLLAFPLHAQTETAPAPATTLTNLYAGGVAWNQTATPQIAGNALYAHAVAGTSTYAFTDLDALPASLKPFTVTTNVGAGVAQKVATFSGVPIFMPTAIGISWTGSNTGWQWNAGVLAAIHLKSARCASCYILPNVRFLKSSVGGGGYQPIVGVDFGWGK